MEQGNPSPLVSVIIPTFNSEKTIERTLKSVLMQTYQNLEIIIIDDHSKDNTISILQNYQSSDTRIKLILKKNNKGVADSRNIGIERATGKYVAFLDGDDEWESDKILHQLSYMELNNIDFTYTSYIIKEDHSNRIRGIQLASKYTNKFLMTIGNNVGCSTVMINKEKIGVISIPHLEKRNDMALWLKVLDKTKEGHGISAPLSTYYKRKDSLSSGKKVNLLKHHYRVFRVSEGYGVLSSIMFTICNVNHYIYKKLRYYKKK